MNDAEFIQTVAAAVPTRQLTGDRGVKLTASQGPSLFIAFVNLPQGVGSAGGGAEAWNNRMSFKVTELATGKVKIETMTSSLPREWNLRAKTGEPAKIAAYLAGHLAAVVAAVEPKYTHTKAC